jgi:hypothetical protein
VSQEPSEVNVKYHYVIPDDLTRHFVNGVYGGRTPQGDILCTFFFEHGILPKEENVVFKNGEKEQRPPDVSNIELQRDFEVSIIMSPLQAKTIGEWIIKSAEGVLAKGTKNE